MRPWRGGLCAGVAALVAGGCSEYIVPPVETTLPPYESRVEDFTQSAVPGRDILWVIDNTRSMKEEAAALAPLFSAFVGGLNFYDGEISYQIGIITTDLVHDGGALQGMPWIITPETPNAEAAFAANVNGVISDTPGVPAPEEGLDSLVQALSTQMLAPGAPNYGFLRSDAGLSIIAVSDSDDLSQGVLTDYIDFLVALKGGSSPDQVIFSAIAGPPENGCLGTGGRSAAPAPRYYDMTEALNGEFASICSDNFTEVMASLGQHQAALKSRFLLSEVPVEDSLWVWVEQVWSPEGSAWTYDASLNAVVFNRDAVPPYGAVVRVAYLYDPTATP